MSYSQRLNISLIGAALGIVILLPDSVLAVDGPYLQSAHGASIVSAYPGVKRAEMTGYATGNCAHCHEMHASLAGDEPEPTGSGPNAYTLFATNFNSGTSIPGSYLVADNFCFYCHSSLASVQAVVNADYSTTFGGGTTGTLPQYIMEAFNQLSYHDLGNIHTFVDGEDALFPWYTQYSNPCNACHNPHLAKRNYEDFTAPLSSAISKPSEHFALWGEAETMASYSYEPPYSNASNGNREPDDTTTIADSLKTPDYVGFCTDCHNVSNTTIGSTTLGRSLHTIDWLNEKHGAGARDGGIDIREPYATAIGNGNFVLSCLDCHEPHGSSSIMLFRGRVNGENLEADITTTDNMGAVCRRCHTDDSQAIAGQFGDWEHVHHFSGDAPYPAPNNCNACHQYGIVDPPGQPKIPCGYCHFHGGDDSWVAGKHATILPTNRDTF